jgi:hypothetical protein
MPASVGNAGAVFQSSVSKAPQLSQIGVHVRWT